MGTTSLVRVYSLSLLPSSGYRLPYARDFPFNDVLNAFVTLFELLTLEGWPEVRELFSDKSNPGGERANLVC